MSAVSESSWCQTNPSDLHTNLFLSEDQPKWNGISENVLPYQDTANTSWEAQINSAVAFFQNNFINSNSNYCMNDFTPLGSGEMTQVSKVCVLFFITFTFTDYKNRTS